MVSFLKERRLAMSEENTNEIVPTAPCDDGFIKSRILTIRGVQVILDRDLAALYGVETGALNRQVKRNEERFPGDFMFRLSAEEWVNLKCQNGISSWGGDRQLPYAFNEYSEKFHDRLLIVDDKELYLIGASLKDLGRKCFAFTKLDPGDISRIKKAAFASS